MSASTRASEPTHNGVIEVSELDFDRVRRYALEADDVYFERRGGRTFLVTDA
ncbi:MAG: hypothetical protein ACI8U4_000216 [Natronomonas sp.]|jgi:hypothetical protein